MEKVKEEMILIILAQESLNLELWLERYEGLKFRGLFCKFFSGQGPLWNYFSKTRGLSAKTKDRRLITQKSNDLFGRFLNQLE
jgi:hypothetical protein